MFEGCERLFRPGYLANLTQSWIPALDGVQAKLERGANVASTRHLLSMRASLLKSQV